MFSWYRGSSLTIVFLRGVSSPSKHGDLVCSIWNSRIWTFQEYHASKVVRFYNEDWTLYKNLDIPNHKVSPEIISEMEEATRVSADALTALQPGLDKIREKLCLASRRQTTVPEDAAYALFGIFSVSLPVVYGERDHALGRLLARLLTSAGDTSILAWTGRSGSFNSCLPAEITVFSELPTTYIPLDIGGAEMDGISARLPLGASQRHITSLVKLYDRVYELPVPSFADNRMKLPCISFPLGRVSATLVASERVFQVRTAIFGVVEIRTTENLTRYDSLILVHPWIDFLLDQRPVEDNEDVAQSPSSEGFSTVPSPTDMTRPEVPSDDSSSGSQSSARRDAAAFVSDSSVVSTDLEALQFLARMRQPFGALLLTPIRRNVAEYRRVAADCVIRVQIREDVSLDDLSRYANVRTLDVL
ncbi:hypothetical protein JVU11DRAFT_9608 [Chiua virens]|nr:hypothetical protein JVU11DRAFT_9608 [Chiua virens]